jgi:hypothetical protein
MNGSSAPAELNPGKFQLPLAQNRIAPQNGPELTSKWIISTGQAKNFSAVAGNYCADASKGLSNHTDQSIDLPSGCAPPMSVSAKGGVAARLSIKRMG